MRGYKTAACSDLHGLAAKGKKERIFDRKERKGHKVFKAFKMFKPFQSFQSLRW
jgi:hypothetical protein